MSPIINGFDIMHATTPQGGGGTTLRQAEVDFGATGVCEATFVIVDAAVSGAARIVGQVAYVAPTGKDLDEMEMDVLDLRFAAGDGEFTLYARSLEGDVAGTFKIHYLIG